MAIQNTDSRLNSPFPLHDGFKVIDGKLYYTGMHGLNNKKVPFENLDITNFPIVQKTLEVLLDTIDPKFHTNRKITFIERPHSSGGIYKDGYIGLSPVSKNDPGTIIHEMIHALSDNGNGKVGFSIEDIENSGHLINEGFTELATQEVLQNVPDEITNQGMENICIRQKKVEKTNKSFAKLFSRLDKGNIHIVDTLETFNNYIISSYIDYQSYFKETELAKTIIKFASINKQIGRNIIYDAYFKSDRSIFIQILGAEKSQEILKLNNTHNLLWRPDISNTEEIRDNLIEVLKTDIESS